MNRFGQLLILVMALLLLTETTFADYKIKIRQTVGGMTSESTTYVKGKRERSEQDFGGFKSVAIKQCDMRRNIQLNPMTKTYTLDSWASANAFIQNSDGVVFTKISASSYEPNQTVRAQQKGGTVTVTMSIRDTGERKQMFGYTARHIFVTTSMVSSKDSCNGPSEMKTETEGWYIDAEFDLDCEPIETRYDRERNIEERKPDCKDRYIVKNSGSAKLGFALYEKITMQNNGQPFVMIREVIELSRATLDQALFEIPADYKEQMDGESNFALGGFDMGAINAEIEAAKARRDVEDSENEDSPTGKESGKVVVQDFSPPTKSRDTATLRQKDPNVIRIGIAELKSGEIGEGMSADILVGSIGNAFPGFFEGTGIEIVKLKAKLPSAIAKEAKEAECDFFMIGTVSHKRDGGGFGFARSLGNIVGNNIPYGGGTAESVARQTASSAAYEIGDAASSVKAKDEITFQLVLTKSDGTQSLSKAFKRKAKSGGEDIISPILEEAADAIVTASQK
jgi:hypothetical protein